MKWAGLLLAAALLAGLAAAAPVQAQGRGAARTIDDCEKLTNAHAYNLCLASFGPRRGQAARAPQPQAEGPETRVYGRAGPGRRQAAAALRGARVERAAGGRKRIIFDLLAPPPKIRIIERR